MEYCSNCGKQVDEKDPFCSICGHQLHTENEAATLENIEVTEHDKQHDNMKQFVGENWEYYDKKWKKMDGKRNLVAFNFASFFLTFFWLGYRKMYKAVFLIAGFYLIADIFLYIIGYKYDVNSFIDPSDRIISMVVYITLGLYGNYFYQRHAQKQVRVIQDTTADSAEKEVLFKKRGGRSWLGVLLAVLIMAGVYFIPTWFIPMNFNDVDIVKSTEFYDYPDVTIEEIFDTLFENRDWEHVDSTDGYEIVEFTGEKQFDGQSHNVAVQFALDEDSDSYETEITFVAIDGEELDMYESNQFIDELFEEHKELDGD